MLSIKLFHNNKKKATKKKSIKTTALKKFLCVCIYHFPPVIAYDLPITKIEKTSNKGQSVVKINA